MPPEDPAAVGTGRPWWRRPRTWLLAVLVAVLLVLAFAPSWVTPYSPSAIDADHLLSSPSWRHPLGTDELGADLLTRIIYGFKLELIISVGSTAGAALLGIASGTLAALSRPAVRGTVNGLATGLLAFPLILLAVLIVASFGASATSLVVVLGIAFWPQVHLLVRGQVQSIMGRDFVTAARLLGVPMWRIAVQHLVPNSLRPLFVLCPQLMSVAILTEAGLSFLGLGVQSPQVTWGVVLLSSKDYYQAAPWYAISAGAVITLTSFVLMMVGDRFATDRRRRRSRRRPATTPVLPTGLVDPVEGGTR